MNGDAFYSARTLVADALREDQRQDRADAAAVANSAKLAELAGEFSRRRRPTLAEITLARHREQIAYAARPGRADEPGAAIFDGAHMGRLADSDDTSPFAPVDHAATVRRIQEANEVFARVCSDDTGTVVDAAQFEKKRAERAELRRQSHAIAEKLEAAGVTGYRSGMWSLWTVGVHSDFVEVIPQFRRIAFLPFVASQIREPFVRALEFFMQKNIHCRFWTFTSGKRCRVADLRERLQELHRRISLLNGEDFMKEAGAEIVFRSSELGTPEKERTGGQLDPDSGGLEKDESGAWYHPHAHTLLHLKNGRLSNGKWKQLLADVWAFWGHHWDDGGSIRTAREAVKYVTKPGDILGLSGDELKELFHALSRLKMTHPMGELAAEIKAREEAGETLLREPTDDGYIWRAVPAWNKRPTPPNESGRVMIGCDLEGNELYGECSDLDSVAMMQVDARMTGNASECRIVARCSPACGPVNVKEPRVVVMGNTFDLATVQAHPLFQQLRRATREEWLAGCAIIRVHTGTPTVGKTAPLAFMANVAERVRPPADPVFL